MNFFSPVREVTQSLVKPRVLYCPFASRIHEQVLEVHANTQKWLAKYDLLEDSEQSRLKTEAYTWLVARVYPYARIEVLQPISDFTSWLFLHDDLCDESREAMSPDTLRNRFEREMQSISGNADARSLNDFERALKDCWDRIQKQSPGQGWSARCESYLADYLNACVWESENRKSATVPNLKTYAAMRGHTGAVWLYMHFIELAQNQLLPLHLLESPEIRHMRELACNVVSWHNDIFFYAKEKARGDMHGLVQVLEFEDMFSSEEAFERAITLTNSEVHEFRSIENRIGHLPDKDQTALSQYVESLKAFMRGALDWSAETTRYSDAGEKRVMIESR